MILQALTKLYDDLSSKGEISKPGWSKVKVGYAISLDATGNLIKIIPLTEEVERKGKTVVVNQTMDLPAPVKRSSNSCPNFLWDNSSYVLGLAKGGKNGEEVEINKSRLDLFRSLNHHILDQLSSEAAKAVLSFLDGWDPAAASSSTAFLEVKNELLDGQNITFRVNGRFISEDQDIRNAWDRHYDTSVGTQIQCLVTGEDDILESVHPSIKGVKNAQSSGAAIVSFNAPAFCSYNHEQGGNAPVGKRAAFSYTTALNHLLADRDNVQIIGDATVVSWAEGGDKQYAGFSAATLFGKNPPAGLTDDDLHSIVKRLAEGTPCPELELDPQKEFYILGLSPNAARISVRFFYRSTFGELMKNINDHQERLRIIGSRYSYMPLWALLGEIVNLKSKDKTPDPVLAGAIARSVFTGAPYPTALLEQAEMRISAERNITPGRAAILKAYFIKNNNKNCPKEVLSVSLNESSTNIPYTIGRLFAIYEEAQEKANPGINATIKDKYFNSVAATPALILPVLNDLYQKHLRKMDPGMRVYFEKRVAVLLGILNEDIPKRLSLPERGALQLGYYHQNQKRYEKKENK